MKELTMIEICMRARKLFFQPVKYLPKIIAPLSVGIFVFFLRTYRLSFAPDLWGDEILYFSVGLSFLRGTPFNLPPSAGLWFHTYKKGGNWFIHPPLHYFFLASLFQTFGISNETLSTIFLPRYISAFFSGSIAVLLFVFLKHNFNAMTAVIATILFALDSYTLMYTRVALLEPVAIFFMALTYISLFKAVKTKKNRDFALSGFFFGLALLSKEIVVVLVLFFVAIYLLLLRRLNNIRVSRRQIRLFLSIATYTYFLYPAWGLITDPIAFINYKLYMIGRVTGQELRPETGYQPIRESQGLPVLSGASFFTDFYISLPRYIVTWAILGLSLVIVLIKIREKDTKHIFLRAWFLGSFLGLIVIHVGNPQFLLYLLVPAFLVIAYTVVRLILACTTFRFRSFIRLNRFKRTRKSMWLASGLIGLTFFAAIGYDLKLWYENYYIGRDDAFVQMVAYINNNVPKKVYIGTGWASDFQAFLPDFVFYSYRSQNYPPPHRITLSMIAGKNLQYFILSPRWNNIIDPDLLRYIKSNGTVIVSFHGYSRLSLTLTYIQNPI